jgi:hypothetical protein
MLHEVGYHSIRLGEPNKTTAQVRKGFYGYHFLSGDFAILHKAASFETFTVTICDEVLEKG